MPSPSTAPCPCTPVNDSRECSDDYVPPSAEELAALDAGIQSAKECPEGIYLGSFAQYADDDE